MEELDVSPLLMADLTTPVPKNSAVKVEHTIKITLDLPVIKRIDVEHPYEIKFIVSKQSLLTVQYEEMSAIDRFKRQFEVAATLRRSQKHLTGGHLYVSLMNNLYESASIKLDYMESKLADIESDIFKHNEKQMVFDISDISKKLISFRHVIRGHEDVFREVRELFDDVYGKTFTDDLQSLQGQYFILLRRTNTLFETLTALRETNFAMLSTRENEIIKTLTIMAFITFPLTLLSSMFGMNVATAPIIGKENDFWIIVSIMCAATVGFFMYFRHKGWM